MEGQKTKILLGARCSRTMVSNRLVPLENYLEDKGVSVHCVHGDSNFYPLAKVEIRCEGSKAHRGSSAVAVNPTVPVLLGTDISQLFQLLGRHPEETCPQDVPIMMRARARQQLEEEILRRRWSGQRERERSVEESTNGSPKLSFDVPKREDPVVTKSEGISDISADKLQRLQEHDSTLSNIRQMVTR